MSDYAIVHVDEIAEHDDGQVPMRPVRHHLGITGFGVNAWVAQNAGDRMIPEHQEADENEDVAERDEELYLVVQGRATFELDGERKDAPAGTFVFVKPRVKRTAFAEEAGTVIVTVGGTPGKPYNPVGWELWYPLRRLYEAGEYAQVVERGRQLIDANAPNALLAYNVACCESLTGHTADALTHLRSAVELSDMFREYARNDSDLDAIRDQPAFEEIVGTATAP
jgi:mannose-6-phosphate isomerase-like protein (cupin superfamily)